MKNCLWIENDDGVWETSCGDMLEFTVDSPTKNNFKYCPYCGGELVEEVKDDRTTTEN